MQYKRIKAEKMTKVVGGLTYDSKVIIGQGFFGIVYSGFCSANESMVVAVKKIQLGRVKEEDVKKEVELMIKAKDHPNILRYISKEMDDDFVYIATELCQGTLQQYITGEGYSGSTAESRFSSEREIIFQLSQGLAHLHGLNIVHRDIKPTNILIYVPPPSDKTESYPQVKLADFGRSKITDTDEHTETSNSNPKGTRGWMAPEVYLSKKVDSKVDIFALGLIFGYTLSGGKHPFGDDPDKRLV